MVNEAEAREFLVTRRAKVTPDQVELTSGANRRVPGLRRSEVAMLAGVSVEYYSRVERGSLAGVSESVLDSIARALLLDDAEREHLFDLARAANASATRPPRRPSARASGVRPSVQLVLDAVTAGPAFVRNGRMDVLAGNRLWFAMYSSMYEKQPHPANLARFTFLHRAESEQFYPDWDLAADTNVGILRTEAGRDPYDKSMQDLIGELSTRSQDFRTRWGAHDVRKHASGGKHFHHPVVGELHLVYEAMDLMSDPGLNFLIYTAQPESPSADAIQLLATWAATMDAAAASNAEHASS